MAGVFGARHIADAPVTKYEAELADTTIAFAVSGDPTELGAYARIDGPSVWIELRNRPGVVTSSLHHHSVYRDKSAYHVVNDAATGADAGADADTGGNGETGAGIADEWDASVSADRDAVAGQVAWRPATASCWFRKAPLPKGSPPTPG